VNVDTPPLFAHARFLAAFHGARVPLPTVTPGRVLSPGTADGPFRLLYVLERESLEEVRNATVHAFLCWALNQTSDGYRLYWGVYVKPVSWLTPVYMGIIEPFRRFVVYPSIFRAIRRA
jgi:hypothetical protein